MAKTYAIIGTIPTTELLGGGLTQPAQQTSVRAIPSGVTFSLVIAKADYTAARLDLILGPISKAVNAANDVEGVADFNLYQDVNGQGQFVNMIDARVTSTSGKSAGDIHPPYGSIFDDRFAQAVAAERALLDSLESDE